MQESFGAGVGGNAQGHDDGTARSAQERTPRATPYDDRTPRRDGYPSDEEGRSFMNQPHPMGGGDEVVDLSPASGWIHPSHRGTSYVKKAPKKKKKKKKRPKSPSQGAYGNMPQQPGDGYTSPDGASGYGYQNQGTPFGGGAYDDGQGGYSDQQSARGMGFGGATPGTNYGDRESHLRDGQGTDIAQSQYGGGAGGDSFAGGGVPFPVTPGEMTDNEQQQITQGQTKSDNLLEDEVPVAYVPGQRRGGGKTGRHGVTPDEEDFDELGIEHDKYNKRKKKKKKKKKKPKGNTFHQPDLYVNYEAQVEHMQAEGHKWNGIEIEDPDKFWELIVPDEEMEARDLNWVGALSYKKVKRHQYVMHPRNRATRQEFDWWGCDMSYIPLYPFRKKAQWITPAARELGVGGSLFLLTQKAFAWLFLILLILNVPLMMFYVRGSGDPAEQGAQAARFTDLFGYLSLGNLGVSDYTCANLNIAKHQKTLRFNCPYGTMRELTEYGLQKIDNQSCTYDAGTYLGENNKKDDLQLDCNFENGLSQYGQVELIKAFNEQCYDKKYCEMKVLYAWFNKDCRHRLFFYAGGSEYSELSEYMNWMSWYQRNSWIREPVVWSVAFCVADQVFNPLTGEEMPFKKGTFLYFIILVDALCILISIFFFWLLDMRSREYIEIFDKRAVEVRDFTIRLGNLPYDHEYGGKDIMLQAQLWNHVEICLQNALQDSGHMGKPNPELPTQQEMQDNKQWELVDITFHKNDMRETELLDAMDAIDRKKKTLIRKIQMLKIDKEKRQAAKPQIEGFETQIIDYIQEYKLIKADYMKIIDEKLYEKYEITDTNGRHTSDYSIEYAYVTFRSMVAKEKAMQVFEYAELNANGGNTCFDCCRCSCCNWSCWTSCYDCCTCGGCCEKMFDGCCDNSCCSGCCFGCCESAPPPQPDPRLVERMFFGRWLTIQSPTAPSQIQWRNIIYSECNRFTRNVIIWFIAAIIMALAFYGFLEFKNYNDGVVAGAGLETKCPVEPVDAEVALEDWQKPPKQRQGFTHCFCLPIYNTFGEVSSALEEFQKVDKTLVDNPCDEWLWIYQNAMYLTIIAGIMISMINGIAFTIFMYLPPLFEKSLTYREEIYLQFERICVILFLNVGVLYLLADFGLGQAAGSTGPFAILAGKHRDFDPGWYFDVGAKICIATICNAISPTYKLYVPFQQWAIRYYLDRCCWKHLRKVTNITDMEERAEWLERQREWRDERAAWMMNRRNRNAEGNGGAPANNASAAPPEDKQGGNEGGSFSSQEYDGGDQAGSPAAPQAEDGETPQDAEPPKKPFDYDDPNAEYEVAEDEAETQQFFQDDLNEVYTGMLMEVFYSYSYFMCNLLVFYMYSGGMPIMYLFAVIHFVISYIVHKYLMLMVYRKSYNFDEEIPLYTITLMKYGLFFHCCMIVFMFTNKRLLTPEGYDTEMHYRPRNERPDLFFSRRYDIAPSQIVALVAFSVCVVWCIYRCFGCCWWYCCTRAYAAQNAASLAEEANVLGEEGAKDQSFDIYRDYNVRGLRNLYVRSVKEFEQFRTMFNAISYDQEKLSDDYAKEFKKRLKQRILDLEDTIDVHLNLIGGLERFMDKNYMYKLAVLEANEEKIPLRDESAMRLVDITQSYHVMDSLDFQKTGNHLQMLDREILELDKKNDNDRPVYC